MNVEIMLAAGFHKQVALVDKGLCPFCEEQIIKDNFRDELSYREYMISGLCQSCQDDFFKEE
jgi:uncharacterized CHY-type Zn-finger protein